MSELRQVPAVMALNFHETPQVVHVFCPGASIPQLPQVELQSPRNRVKDSSIRTAVSLKAVVAVLSIVMALSILSKDDASADARVSNLIIA